MASVTISGTASTSSLIGFRIAASFVHSMAISMTTFRVVHRWRRGKLFWDDIWAMVAAFFDSFVLVCVWLRMHQNNRAKAGNPTSNESRIATYMISSLSFTCVLWTARISLSCSILRLLPPGRFRKSILCMTWAFGGFWLALFAMKCWTCGHNTSWIVDCPLGHPFIILKLSCDTVADTLLVTIPLYMLWHSKLPKVPRRMIRVVFAASVLTTIISAVHATYAQSTNRRAEGYIAQFEASIIVIVCNLLVLVTFFYRIIRNGLDLDDELTTYLTEASTRAPITVTPLSLTQISIHSEPGLSLVRRGSSIFFDALSPISKGSRASGHATASKNSNFTSNLPS